MAPTPLPLIPWPKTSLLSARCSLESSIVVQQTAVDLFALGYPRLANQLIDALYAYSHGIEFGFNFLNGPSTAKSLYDAWEATDTMPSYIKNPDPDKIFNGRNAGDEPSKKRWARLDEDWVNGLPENMREKALNGGLDAEHLKFATERANMLPEGASVDESLKIAAVVQVAMLVGERSVAQDLVNENVVNLYRHMQEKWDDPNASGKELRDWLNSRLGLHHSPEIWKILTDAAIGKALNVDEKALEAFVHEGCDLIKQRFTQGPARPYANKSISELLQIMDESYIAARKANPEAGEHMSVLGVDSLPSSFLKPPATEDDVNTLEERLSSNVGPDANNDKTVLLDKPVLPEKHLPDDYKEFLRTSNGFEVEQGDETGIFYGVKDVGTKNITFLHEYEYTLFPYAYTAADGIDNIDLIKFTGFDIGAGGDEGYVVVVPPPNLKPVLEAFETAYAEASEKNKRLYERAALDLYGGLEAVRALEWLVVVMYHWDPDQEVWGSFREYLEHCVEYAEDRRKDDEGEAKKEKKEEEGEEDANAGEEDEADDDDDDDDDDDNDEEDDDDNEEESEEAKGTRDEDKGSKRKRSGEQTEDKTTTPSSSDTEMGDADQGSEKYNLRDRKSQRTE